MADKEQWIPINEKLPKEKTPVLVTNKDAVLLGFLENGIWYTMFGGLVSELHKVTAWYPIPKPYNNTPGRIYI